MIIGTAGHIDHGKTALVKALTGIDADRLAEEKRRGITIDLGFAYTDTPHGTFGFVDVPGHERFVHTMLAGATGIDAALLVVALDDGVMPQTREHIAILDLLGIDRGVVALTKSDIAADHLPIVAAEVAALLAQTGLRGSPLLPVSAITGAGVATLTDTLHRLGPRQRDSTGHPRLAIDRAFTLSGAGLIVTGTLVSGRIQEDDRLLLSPPGLDLRVRGLHAQNKAATVAEAGQRVALNIAGPRLSRESVTRGDWILHPDIHAPTSAIDVRLRLLAEEKTPLRADTPAHLHLGAAHVMARVFPLDRDRLRPGETGMVRIALSQAIGALAGDRLVLRDAGASRTMGGGHVVDPFPPPRGRRTPARLAQLAALEAVPVDAALRGLLALPPGWTGRAQFLLSHNIPAAAADAVQAATPAVPLADLLIAPATLDSLRQDLLRSLAAWHASAPDQPGLQPERLRQQLTPRPPPALFRSLLDAFLQRGTLRQDGPWLRLNTHQIQLSAGDSRLWPSIRDGLAANRFRPPRTRDLAPVLSLPEAAIRATLKRLQRVGRVIEVAPDHFFLRETVAEMAEIAAALAKHDPNQQLTAAAFRDRLDNGRKVAIQILEFFDRIGVTARAGDVRTVREDRLALVGAAPPDDGPG